jgi:prepilin-type N-terminal cleavage/methylation domain-containing protein
MRLNNVMKGSRQQGYTFLELLLAVTITGIGICAVMAGLQNGLWFAHTSGSIELARLFAESMRQFSEDLEFNDPDGGGVFGPEESLLSDFDDINDLDGLVQSPPIHGDGSVMTAFPEWTQKVSVDSVDPSTLATVGKGGTKAVQVTVVVERDGEEMRVYRWLVADR